MAYAAGPTGTTYGWMFELPGWMVGSDKPSQDDQALWTLGQLQKAQGGEPLSSMYAPGCCTTGTGDITASTFTQAPTNTNGAHLRVGYYLAMAARLGMSVGWDRTSIQELIEEAYYSYDAGKDSWQRNDAESISAVFRDAIAFLQERATRNPSRPLPDYQSLLTRLTNMGSLESIAFSQDLNVGVTDAIAGTGADIAYSFGVGEGGAVAAQERAEQAEREEQRRKMKPLLITGGIALAAGVAYFFFIKED